MGLLVLWTQGPVDKLVAAWEQTRPENSMFAIVARNASRACSAMFTNKYCQTQTRVSHAVPAHLGSRGILRRIQETRDVVVDGLGNCLAVLQVLDLLIHQVKVLSLGVKGCYTLLFPATAIQAVVVIQANDSGHV
jgi:hypothetical protein